MKYKATQRQLDGMKRMINWMMELISTRVVRVKYLDRYMNINMDLVEHISEMYGRQEYSKYGKITLNKVRGFYVNRDKIIKIYEELPF